MARQAVAVLGGCFDPIHRGHLAVARAAAAELPVGRVLVVPNGQPAYRPPPAASYSQRLAMAELAVAQLPAGPNPVQVAELEPPGRPRYAVDTAAKLRSQSLHPILVVGADAFADLQSWHKWQDLLAAASIAVVSRPGKLAAADAISEACAGQAQVAADAAELAEAACVWPWITATPDCSSSSVRSELESGGAAGDECLTPEVAAYIKNEGLYGAQAG